MKAKTGDPEHQKPATLEQAASKGSGACEIAGMEGLSTPERRSMTALGIKSADDFWAVIGQHSSLGITRLASKTEIDQKRLIEIAVSQILRESSRKTTNWLAQLRQTLSDHWLDIAILAWLGLLILLAVRSIGLLDKISPSLGMSTKVIVASTDLQRGTVLKSQDLLVTRLAPRGNNFSEANQPTGLILAQDVKTGDLIRFEQVLKLQIIATKDLPPGTLITNDLIARAWSQYEPNATDNFSQVLGRSVTHPIKSGEAIKLSFVGAESAAGDLKMNKSE